MAHNTGIFPGGAHELARTAQLDLMHSALTTITTNILAIRVIALEIKQGKEIRRQGNPLHAHHRSSAEIGVPVLRHHIVYITYARPSMSPLGGLV